MISHRIISSSVHAVKTAQPQCALLGLLLAASCLIAGCAQNKDPMDVGITSAIGTTQKSEMDYIHTYAAIATGLQKCWLADKMPLQKSQFFARTKNKGEEKSDIFVHGPAESPKRGPRIFSVHLTPKGAGTELLFDNRLLDPLTESKVRADVNRWAKGEEGCSEMAATNEITPERADQLKASRVSLPVRKK